MVPQRPVSEICYCLLGKYPAGLVIPLSSAAACQPFRSLNICPRVSLFVSFPGEVRGCHLRGLLLPKFRHRCRTVCEVQTAGGAAGHSGQELAIFTAGRCPCHQPQVRNVITIYQGCALNVHYAWGKLVKQKSLCFLF